MNIYRQIWIYIKFSVKLFIKKPGFYTLKTTIGSFPAWRAHLEEKSLMSERIPWLTFPSLHFLKQKINSQMIAFEYGSGGSTLFWSEKIKQVISVEHDKEWYARMKSILETRSISNVQYFLIEPEPGNPLDKKDPYNPDDYASDDDAYINKSFENYVKKIDAFPPNYFDMVIVDGRARPSCIKHSLNKIKINGYLIIDNSERSYYLASFKFDNSRWKKWDFPGPVPSSYSFSQTTILQKISE